MNHRVHTIGTVLIVSMLMSMVGPAMAAADSARRGSTFSAYQANDRHNGRVDEPELDPPFKRVWSIAVDRPSYPLIANGRVFITSRKDSDAYGTILRALDTASGDELWRRWISGGYGWSNATYALDHHTGRETVFVENFDGRLDAFDAVNGRLRWTRQLHGQSWFDAPPTATGRTVYTTGAGSGGTMYALRTVDGRLRWRKDFPGGIMSSPAISSEAVFVSYECDHSFAFDRDNGARLWSTAGACIGGGGRTAALSHGRLYTRQITGDDRILDSATGDVITTYDTTSIPAFSGRRMFVLVDGVFESVDPVTGQVTWSETLDGGLRSAPLVVNGLVFMGSNRGHIFAISPTDGAVVWSARLGAAVPSSDAQTESHPLTGLGAGNGLLVVPTKKSLVAFRPV